MIPRWAIKPLRERLRERLAERRGARIAALGKAFAAFGEACKKAAAEGSRFGGAMRVS